MIVSNFMVALSRAGLVTLGISLSELFFPVSVSNQPMREYVSPTVCQPLMTNIDLLNDLHQETTYKILAEEILRQ